MSIIKFNKGNVYIGHKLIGNIKNKLVRQATGEIKKLKKKLDMLKVSKILLGHKVVLTPQELHHIIIEKFFHHYLDLKEGHKILGNYEVFNKRSGLSDTFELVRQPDIESVDQLIKVNRESWESPLWPTREEYIQRMILSPFGMLAIKSKSQNKIGAFINGITLNILRPSDMPVKYNDLIGIGPTTYYMHQIHGNCRICPEVSTAEFMRSYETKEKMFGMNHSAGTLLVLAQKLQAIRSPWEESVVAYSRPSGLLNYMRKLFGPIKFELNPSQEITKMYLNQEEILTDNIGIYHIADGLKVYMLSLSQYLSAKDDKTGRHYEAVIMGFHVRLGAKVIQEWVFPMARPQDKNSLGYNICLKYNIFEPFDQFFDASAQHQKDLLVDVAKSLKQLKKNNNWEKKAVRKKQMVRLYGILNHHQSKAQKIIFSDHKFERIIKEYLIEKGYYSPILEAPK